MYTTRTAEVYKCYSPNFFRSLFFFFWLPNHAESRSLRAIVLSYITRRRGLNHPNDPPLERYNPRVNNIMNIYTWAGVRVNVHVTWVLILQCHVFSTRRVRLSHTNSNRLWMTYVCASVRAGIHFGTYIRRRDSDCIRI